MARQGWIKLWHKLCDSQIWLCEPFSRGQAWVDLLLMASTQETDHPGEIYCSIRYLAKRWKWSRDKVDLFLKQLEKSEMIYPPQKRPHNRPSNRPLLTIVKYKRYQIEPPQKKPQNTPEKAHIEEDKEKAARTADAGGAGTRRVPEAFREWFQTYEEYEEWRIRNS